jgi:outer membrane protein OmpU
MNKLTKYGLTALAGSLVATSVSAGELSVSGSWSWSYDSADSDESGNPMSMGDSVTFSGSGETDQGWTAGVSYELDGGTFDDYKLTLNMGDSGNLTFSGSSVSGDGIHMVNDIVPAADTAVYSMTDTAVAYGVARGADQASNLGYNITVGDVKVSAEMQKGAGTDRTFGFQYTGVENMTLVYGQGEVNPGQTNGGNDETVMGIKYSVAGATLAYMRTDVDIGGANAADEEAVHMGISFAVNDDLTVSYATQEVEITGKGEDETNSGFGISYTMGSMSVAAYAGKTENGNGVSTADDEGKGLTLSIAF